MVKFFTSSLRRAVMLVVLLSALPPLFIILTTGIDRYSDAAQEIIRGSMRSVRHVTDYQELMTGSIRNALLTLSQAEEVRAFDLPGVDRFFRAIDPQLFPFSTLFLLDINGKVLSSSKPADNPEDFPNRFFLQLASEMRFFSMGIVSPSPFGTGLTVQCALPIQDKRGATMGYLGAELPLNFFEGIFTELKAPDISTFYLLDARGVLAAASPGPEAAVPAAKTDSGLWHALGKTTEETGSFTYTDDSGQALLAVYQKMRLDKHPLPYLYIVLSTPERMGYDLPIALGLTILAALLAALVGMSLSRIGFSRAVNALLQAAEGLRSGNLSVRVAADAPLYGEFAELGEEFDAMAGALEKRSQNLAAAREAADASSTAKSEFLSNISHELKTPMNAIKGMGFLALKAGLNQQDQDRMQEILNSTHTLLRIVDEILDLSRMNASQLSLEPANFFLGHVLENVSLELAEKAAAHGFKCSFSMADHTPQHLSGDPLRLAQALILIAAEAMDHCRQGKIEFGCSGRRQGPSLTTMHFSIALPGELLDEETLAGLNHAAAIDDPEGDAAVGTLPVMYLCRSIVELMGGRITVVNTTLPSSVFTITLPFNDPIAG